MVRGLYENWIFVLSLKLKLKRQIESFLRTGYSLGLNIKAIVCDQGSINRDAFIKYGVNKEVPYFTIDDKQIYGIYDDPYLFKSLRNILMRNSLETPDLRVSWQILVKLFQIDTDITSTLFLFLKLSRKHVYPNYFKNMKVKYATQILSHAVATATKTIIQNGDFADCQDIALSKAIFIERVNKLLDC